MPRRFAVADVSGLATADRWPRRREAATLNRPAAVARRQAIFLPQTSTPVLLSTTNRWCVAPADVPSGCSHRAETLGCRLADRAGHIVRYQGAAHCPLLRLVVAGSFGGLTAGNVKCEPFFTMLAETLSATAVATSFSVRTPQSGSPGSLGRRRDTTGFQRIKTARHLPPRDLPAPGQMAVRAGRGECLLSPPSCASTVLPIPFR